MSKAEKFIQDYTRNCSNVVAYSGMIEGSELRYHEWLTPDQARSAVEIAKEEIIEKFYDWLKSNATYIHPRKGTEECITTLVKLKQAMKDE
jgi:hypothetical protein